MIQWSEKDLEDWLCSPAEEGGAWRLWDVLGDNIPCTDVSATATRQAPLGDMRADILIASPGYLTVVELKCKAATGDDLAQVLHYASWLKARALHKSAVSGNTARPVVLSYLVAPSFSPRMRAAASMARVELIQISVGWVLNDVWGTKEDVCHPLAWEGEGQPCDDLIAHAFKAEAGVEVVDAIEEE